MRKTRLIVGGAVLTLAAVLGLLAWKAPVAKGTGDAAPVGREAAVLVSREVGGNEAITATVRRVGDEVLAQPGYGPDLSAMKGRVITFAVALDTHDGDISKVDLNGKVFVRDAAGVEIPGMARQLSESSHHTTYVAAFPKVDSRGKALDDPANQRITVIIKDVGALKERVLEFKL